MTEKNHSRRRSGRLIDLTGKTFGRLTVVRLDAVKTAATGKGCWVCDCSCGRQTTVYACNFTRNHTTSCGCHKAEHLGEARRTHAMTGSPEHVAWSSMMTRCTNAKSKSFRWYGVRGISVCERLRQFAGFFETLGVRPTSDHSVDREDNDGHYSCGQCDECKGKGWRSNVRWATRIEQGNNTRKNRVVEFEGRVLTLAEWGRETRIPASTLWMRLVGLNWSVERALLTPVRLRGQRK